MQKWTSLLWDTVVLSSHWPGFGGREGGRGKERIGEEAGRGEDMRGIVASWTFSTARTIFCILFTFRQNAVEGLLVVEVHYFTLSNTTSKRKFLNNNLKSSWEALKCFEVPKMSHAAIKIIFLVLSATHLYVVTINLITSISCHNFTLPINL